MRSLFFIVLIGLTPLMTLAAGKRRSPPRQPETPDLEAKPARSVFLAPVQTVPFPLPNGAQIDIAYDLNSMLRQATTQSEQFRPTEKNEVVGTACEKRIEIRAHLSTVELNALELGLKIGYSPSGDFRDLPDLAGQIQVDIGTIAIDFSLWECTEDHCSAVAANTQDHRTIGAQGSFGIDLDIITIGPGFVRNTKFGEMIQKMMNRGIQELQNSARLHELTWKARVREVFPEIDTIIFDAGANERLQSHQQFVVYAQNQDASRTGCDLYLPVAYVHSETVDTVSSTAKIDQELHGGGLQVGDWVMVRPQ